jgi:hypothetical protein
MTRACVAIARGDVVDALRYNPGVVLLVAAVVLAIAAPRVLLRLRAPTWLLIAGFGLLWTWNVGFNPTF